jgi:hypothetical protein
MLHNLQGNPSFMIQKSTIRQKNRKKQNKNKGKTLKNKAQRAPK